MTPKSTSASPRVLVVKLSSMGDLFHVLPAVHALKTGLNARLDWVTQAVYTDLVKCFTDVDRVIAWHRPSGFRSLRAALRELRLSDYDLIVDFQGLLKSAAVARLARGARRIGPSFHREGSWLLYSDVAGPRNKQRHAVDENLDVIRYLRLPLGSPEFRLAFPPQAIDEPAPRVALIPFSRWPSKNWPTTSFVDVGRSLREQTGASLFILGSRAEAADCERMAAQFHVGGGSSSGAIGRVINLAGRTSLPQLGGVLQAMDLVISNDSGSMHMAAAAGVPVLAVFGPTDAVRTGPYGPAHRVLHGDLKCRPCFIKKCRFNDEACLRAVTTDMVVAAATEMLRARLP